MTDFAAWWADHFGLSARTYYYPHAGWMVEREFVLHIGAFSLQIYWTREVKP